MEAEEVLSASDRKKLEELADDVYKIESFLESEFYYFELIHGKKPNITAPDKK